MVQTKYTPVTQIGIERVAGRWRHMDLAHNPPVPVGPAFVSWHEILGQHVGFLKARGFEVDEKAGTARPVERLEEVGWLPH